MRKNIKILLTGGGSGGHVFPVIAVAKQLQEDCQTQNLTCRFLYLGSFSGPEKKITKANHLKFYPVLSGKWRRYLSFWNLVDIFKVILGFFQSLILVLFFWPRVVFAKGGYVTAPIVLAAWLLRRPIVIHESDSILGFANNFEAKLANKICVGFPAGEYHGLSPEKVIYSGNPVRMNFIEKRKNISEDHILVMGGSQGSSKINQLILNVAPRLSKKYKIVHITGERDYEKIAQHKNKNYEVYKFVDNIADLMAKSKLIISRAGANAIAEILTLGKPSILIPLPSAASNHQLKNAQYIQRKGAAICLSEERLTAATLGDIIERIIEDDHALKQMSLVGRNLVRPQAASIISKGILSQRRPVSSSQGGKL